MCHRIPSRRRSTKSELQMIKLRLAITVRPPKARVLNRELGKILWFETNRFGFTRLQCHRLLKFHAFK